MCHHSWPLHQECFKELLAPHKYININLDKSVVPMQAQDGQGINAEFEK